MEIKPITVRAIKEEEINTVFALLVELAEHEKLTDRFKLTPVKMQQALFGKTADWHCLVALAPENDIVGFCLFSFANINRAFNLTPLIHIDDIFVKPPCRALGVGKKLLQATAKIAKQNGIDRIELWCIKDNLEGQSFYKKLAARKLDFLDVYQLEVDSLTI